MSAYKSILVPFNKRKRTIDCITSLEGKVILCRNREIAQKVFDGCTKIIVGSQCCSSLLVEIEMSNRSVRRILKSELGISFIGVRSLPDFTKAL